MRIRTIAFAVAVTAGAFHFSGVVSAQADFEGIWIPDHPPGLGQPPLSTVKLTPAGRAEFERFGPEKDPSFRCIMPGVPRGLADPYPIEIVQQDHQIHPAEAHPSVDVGDRESQPAEFRHLAPELF